MTPIHEQQTITIRRLGELDTAALEKLAELDSSPVPPAPVLGAEVDGSLIAAVSLRSHAEVADPFRRAIEAMQLLRARGSQINGKPKRRGFRRRSRGALAGSPPGAGGRLLQLPS